MKNKPHFKIELKPFWADGTVKYMDISCSVGKPEIKAGQAIVSYCRNVVSIPFCKIDGDIISFWDDQGEIPAESHYAGVLSSFMEMVEWRAKRDTAGDIRYSYRVFPRELRLQIKPYFDFRAKGRSKPGLITVQSPTEYCISLSGISHPCPKVAECGALVRVCID